MSSFQRCLEVHSENLRNKCHTWSTFIDIPNFTLAALIAAAIATSGDGIFPLLAENRKDGFIVSGVGLLIALVVGYIALSLGF